MEVGSGDDRRGEDRAVISEHEIPIRNAARARFDNSDRPWEDREGRLLWWDRAKTGGLIFLILGIPIGWLLWQALR